MQAVPPAVPELVTTPEVRLPEAQMMGEVEWVKDGDGRWRPATPEDAYRLQIEVDDILAKGGFPTCAELRKEYGIDE